MNVVIIGAGLVGVSLAVHAARKSHHVTLCDAGERLPGDSYLSTEGENTYPNNYYPLQDTRISALSGTGHIWGGNCRWFSKKDFKPLASHLPRWLIEKQQLVPYMEECEKLFQINGSWNIADHYGDTPPDRPFFTPQLYKLSPVIAPKTGQRKGTLHETLSEDLKSVHILKKHLLIDVEMERDRVVACKFFHKGQTVRIGGDCFFLCCGGIENARQLLLLAEKNRRIVKYVKHNIGKYWCEHPHPYMGTPLYENTHDSQFYKFSQARRTTQKFVVLPKYTIKNSTEIPGAALSHTFSINTRYDRKFITSINEQMPQRNNMITLSKTKSDDLGYPLAKLTYKVDTMTRERIYRAFMLFASYLGYHDNIRIMIKDKYKRFMQPNYFLGGGHHHMGGTCMGTPKYGVVDQACRLYGVENFAVAGSSVFPRGGSVNPTLNAVALAMYSFDEMTGSTL